MRVVIFLRAIGTHSAIRAAMARAGFTETDHREGWALLQATCRYETGGLDPEDDRPAREALATVTAWVRAHFPRLIAAVERLHPESRKLFAGIVSPSAGEAPVALAKLLERLGALERRGETAVVETFARRGVSAAERERLGALVRFAVTAPRCVDSGPVYVTREAELVVLYRWYVDWSATARATVLPRDWLIVMGLAGRKGRDARNGSIDS